MIRYLLGAPAGAGLTLACAAALVAQPVIGEPSIDVSRLDGQTVPVVFSLSRPDGDAAPAATAVWVFAKFQNAAGGWQDVRWAADGHSIRSETGATDLVARPATGSFFIPGLFLEPSDGAAPSGSWTVELLWDFSTSQIEMPEAGYPVLLVGIDMVRVPEGKFTVGDGRDSEETSTLFGPDGAPTMVGSEDEITVGEGEDLDYAASDYGGDRAGPIPSAYPKGYKSFYVMRRELTEGQYAAFLSTLSGRGLASRDITTNPAYRESGGTIRVGDTITVDQPERPASFITWADAIGWTAWAGLRPMTELEFEKIARGPGAYGVEAILGGRWERTVTLGTPEGRSFTGSHGLGFVDELAQPFTFLNADWPGPMALGSGFRGGFGLDTFTTAGNRVYGAYDATYGGENEGFRAVRTAPEGVDQP